MPKRARAAISASAAPARAKHNVKRDSAGGRPGSPVATSVATRALAIALPTERATELTPLATPVCSGGTAASRTAGSVAKPKAMAIPTSSPEPMTAALLPCETASSAKPAVPATAPSASVRRGPVRHPRTPARRAVMGYGAAPCVPGAQSAASGACARWERRVQSRARPEKAAPINVSRRTVHRVSDWAPRQPFRHVVPC